MNKNNGLLSIIAIMCLCMVCTSCSKDEKLSNRLSGTWRGSWGMSYVDREGIQHNSDYTVIEFHSDKIFETQGYGYQEDYYQDGPFEKIGLYFNWSIDGQDITIEYPGYPKYNCLIRNCDYAMEKKHFTGYIGSTYFDLDKVERGYKWYDYLGFYTATVVAGTTAVLLWAWDSATPVYYDDYYGYGYAKTRSTDTPAASPITMPDGTKVQPAGENCPIRIFNRFAEQEQ
ncbi:MAG: hypothetical protein J6T11_05850 [Bacteroidaceae bacterium]|nr:hypothetical protein [Bacteroidaceae bacterium]